MAICEIHGRELTDVMVSAYEIAFTGIPVELLRDAMIETVATEKYWPTPAHVMERVDWSRPGPDPLSESDLRRVAEMRELQHRSGLPKRLESLLRFIKRLPNPETESEKANIEGLARQVREIEIEIDADEKARHNLVRENAGD